MSSKNRIAWRLRFGVSVSALLLYCNFAAAEDVDPHFYTYPEPAQADNSQAQTESSQGVHYYRYPQRGEYDETQPAPKAAVGTGTTQSVAEALKKARARQMPGGLAGKPATKLAAGAQKAPPATGKIPAPQTAALAGSTRRMAMLPLAAAGHAGGKVRTADQARAQLMAVAQEAKQHDTHPQTIRIASAPAPTITPAPRLSSLSHPVLAQNVITSRTVEPMLAQSVQAIAVMPISVASQAGTAGGIAAEAAREQNLAMLAPAAGAPPVNSITALSTLPDSPLPVSAPAVTGAPLPALPSISVPTASAPADADGALSDQTKRILSILPPEKRMDAASKSPVDVDHFRKTSLDPDAGVKQHESVGIKISVRRPKLDVHQTLENAYDALIAGDQENAIALYKQVLEEQPSNELALFGLATTYHRAGQLQLARPLYGKLLTIDPQNVEGLNNFLVLLADEAPKEALAELEKLQESHPNFSPVPAQMALIYEKMGNGDKAAVEMSHAIDLSPENLKYRYDMAIILDKQGDWQDAAEYYQQLITASDRGEKIPTNPEEIQERLTFIRSNRPKGTT